MSWIAIDTNILDEAQQAKEFANVEEPGVYEVNIDMVYIYKNDKGNEFVGFEGSVGQFPNDKQLNLSWFLRKPDGTATYVKDGKTYPYPGVVDFDNLAKCVLGKRVNELIPVEATIERYGEPTKVLLIKEFSDKKVVIGVRIEEYEKNDGSIGESLKFVDCCKTDDEECKAKLEKRIAKNPRKEVKRKQSTSSNDLPEL